MSLGALNLAVIRDALRRPEHQACTSRRVLSLGYPDILANAAQIEQVLGAEVVSRLAWRGDAQSILRWHGATHTDRVAEADSLFRALGLELDVIDIATARGGEILQDLNEPVPESLHGRYAAVLDAGTLEHCFNIGVAARNVASLVAEHGFVMHGNPLNMYNHGFYNLSPTWYHEFYTANGFRLEYAGIVFGPLSAQQVTNSPIEKRFGGAPDNCVNLVVARRVEMRERLEWPTQAKYRNNPTLQG